MADVTIKYKGSTIAEMNGTGSKTLNTSGTYCEGNVEVAYTPKVSNSKTYEITLAKASGWVLLTTLDDEVLAHINDNKMVVSISCIDAFEYENYAMGMATAGNTAVGQQGNYPVYGMSVRQSSATATYVQQVYYPPNKTDTSTSLGGGGGFRVTSGKYYWRPSDGYARTATYRLTFVW